MKQLFSLCDSLGQGIDANIGFLDFPKGRHGKLTYVIVQAWSTAGQVLVDVGIFDRVEILRSPKDSALTDEGEWTFIGLQEVRIENGVVDVGNEEPGDIASWRVFSETELLLYRYVVDEKVVPTMLEPLSQIKIDAWDASMLDFAQRVAQHGALQSYQRHTGKEIASTAYRAS